MKCLKFLKVFENAMHLNKIVNYVYPISSEYGTGYQDQFLIGCVLFRSMQLAKKKNHVKA